MQGEFSASGKLLGFLVCNFGILGEFFRKAVYPSIAGKENDILRILVKTGIMEHPKEVKTVEEAKRTLS